MKTTGAFSVELSPCAEALSDNSTLKVLDIDRSVSPDFAEWIMSADGWIIFFEFLKSCDLRSLNLQGNTIADENIASMVDALITMESLTDLNLQLTRITSSGWIDFFRLGGLSKLAKLDIFNVDFNDEVMIALARALVGNSSLKDLSIGFESLDSVTHGGGWAAMYNTLCDKSSIESICNSNHTLTMSDDPLDLDLFGVPDSIIPLLHLNTGENKACVAREKIFRYYFEDGRNLRVITNMQLEVLPRVLAEIGKADTGVKLLYHIAKGMPALFDSTSKAVVAGKRKRGDN